MSKLLPGENLVIKDHPHWITVVGSLILPAVLVIAVAIADFIRRSPRPHKMALLVGSEAHGLSPEALAAADACVRAFDSSTESLVKV